MSKSRTLPWAVVENAGYEGEQITSEHHSFSEATKQIEKQYAPIEIETMPVIIMRRNDDGALTTEF
jgi:hypothetical protein